MKINRWTGCDLISIKLIPHNIQVGVTSIITGDHGPELKAKVSNVCWLYLC